MPPREIILDVEFDSVSPVHYIQWCLFELPVLNFMPSSLDLAPAGPFLDALEFLADFELKPLFITNCARFFELPMFACVPFQEQYVLNL